MPGLGATVIQCLTRTVNYSPTGADHLGHADSRRLSITGYAIRPGRPRRRHRSRSPPTARTSAPSPRTATRHEARARIHGQFQLPGSALPPGERTDLRGRAQPRQVRREPTIQCVTHNFNWNPTVARRHGHAEVSRRVDHRVGDRPRHDRSDRSAIMADGKKLIRVTASGHGKYHSGHRFAAIVPLPDGTHTRLRGSGQHALRLGQLRASATR